MNGDGNFMAAVDKIYLIFPVVGVITAHILILMVGSGISYPGSPLGRRASGEMLSAMGGYDMFPLVGVITAHRFVKEASDEMIYSLEFRFSNRMIYRRGYSES